MFDAYETTCFSLLSGCSSFSKVTPWLKSSSTSKELVHAPWDRFHIDIFDLIFELLDLEDRIRFKLVCKQWRDNTKQISQPLWLMFPHQPNNECLSFFDMCDGKVVKLNLPKSVRGGWVFGCSKGWLFLAMRTTFRKLRILLFDPISKAQIPLPLLPTTSSFKERFIDRLDEWIPSACTIGSVESSSCIVAVIFGEYLAVCRPGDQRWTLVEGLLAEGYSYGNIIFFKGELYASVMSTEDVANNVSFQTHSITIGSRRVKLKLIYSPPPSLLLFYDEDADGMLSYHKDCNRLPCLLESNGQLLMVTQILDAISTHREEENLLRYLQAADFQIFKIQTTEDALCLTSLPHLDNQSLFLGIGDCLALNNPDKFHKNCIYFLQLLDYENDLTWPYVCREAGVYHLDDGSIKRCLPSIQTENNSFMHWFSPNINSVYM
ncbi:hypothetical protein V6N11_040754 [Hibiscus sabdariffa]|uniref:F-box domain-containing protein n=1 Tax=Hibiscus sabdariffa TaxID=183260 RepID=A0ABR2RIG5_9ROSI